MCEGKELFKSFDMAVYSKMNFGMFHGEVKKVHISFPDYMVGVFIDRFGKDYWTGRRGGPDAGVRGETGECV